MHRPRFQAIHDLATAQVDAARKELGRLEARRGELLVAIADADAALIAAGADAGPRLRQQYQLFWTTRTAEIGALHGQVTAIEAQLERARAALRDAHRRVVSLDALRERDHDAWVRDEARREQRRNDEFATTRPRPEVAA
jgi:flagellar protein FliJ